MRRIAVAVVALGIASFFASMPPRTILAADAPTDRTIVMYFHRTQRCPTCKKMGNYSEEAVKTGFADQLKSGKVEFHFVNFQDDKNAELTKGYKVAGPTLIVAKIVGGKVAEFKNLTEIWAKAGDRAAFVEYVQSNVKATLK